MSETVTIALTKQELTALVGMLDAAVRAVGLKSVKDAAAIIEKLERAITETEDVSSRAMQ